MKDKIIPAHPGYYVADLCEPVDGGAPQWVKTAEVVAWHVREFDGALMVDPVTNDDDVNRWISNVGDLLVVNPDGYARSLTGRIKAPINRLNLMLDKEHAQPA